MIENDIAATHGVWEGLAELLRDEELNANQPHRCLTLVSSKRNVRDGQLCLAARSRRAGNWNRLRARNICTDPRSRWAQCPGFGMSISFLANFVLF
jgi:hypothetical protein